MTMGNVPPDLFRRRMTLRALEQVEAKADLFEAHAGTDNHYAALASYNDMAARFAALSGRPDLAQQFAQQRDELIAKGQAPAPITPGQPKKKP